MPPLTISYIESCIPPHQCSFPAQRCLCICGVGCKQWLAWAVARLLCDPHGHDGCFPPGSRGARALAACYSVRFNKGAVQIVASVPRFYGMPHGQPATAAAHLISLRNTRRTPAPAGTCRMVDGLGRTETLPGILAISWKWGWLVPSALQVPTTACCYCIRLHPGRLSP